MAPLRIHGTFTYRVVLGFRSRIPAILFYFTYISYQMYTIPGTYVRYIIYLVPGIHFYSKISYFKIPGTGIKQAERRNDYVTSARGPYVPSESVKRVFPY